MVHLDPETMTSFSRQHIVLKLSQKNDIFTVEGQKQPGWLKYW